MPARGDLFKYIAGEKGVAMKIYVFKSPKLFSGLLRSLFGMKPGTIDLRRRKECGDYTSPA